MVSLAKLPPARPSTLVSPGGGTLSWTVLRRAALVCIFLVAIACGPPESGNDAASLCTSDAQCDDGAFCNGVERCAPSEAVADDDGCVRPNVSSCAVSETCDEVNDRCLASCADADGDGEQRFECGGTDCDDTTPLRAFGRVEVCDAAGRDEDCDRSTFGPDGDGDGAVSRDCCNVQTDGSLLCGRDCADDNADVGPSAIELCDGLDNDCAGGLDFPGEDDDGDGFADCAELPDAFRDCDDARVDRFPGAPELCNRADDDCDDLVDDGFDCSGVTPVCAPSRTACGPCQSELDCPENTFCYTSGPIAGACAQCHPSEIDYCASGIEYCNPDTFMCAVCLVDEHCMDTGFGCQNNDCVCEIEGQCACENDVGEFVECGIGESCIAYGIRTCTVP